MHSHEQSRTGPVVRPAARSRQLRSAAVSRPGRRRDSHRSAQPPDAPRVRHRSVTIACELPQTYCTFSCASGGDAADARASGGAARASGSATASVHGTGCSANGVSAMVTRGAPWAAAGGSASGHWAATAARISTPARTIQPGLGGSVLVDRPRLGGRKWRDRHLAAAAVSQPRLAALSGAAVLPEQPSPAVASSTRRASAVVSQPPGAHNYHEFVYELYIYIH